MGVQPSGIRAHFADIMQAIGLQTNLAALGIHDLEDIAASVNPQRLANNPRPLTHNELLKILQADGD